MAIVTVRWVRQGTPQWEQQWVSRRGRTRTHEPTKAEHISFANYDLRDAGLGPLVPGDGDELSLEIDPEQEAMAGSILKRHGFEIVP